MLSGLKQNFWAPGPKDHTETTQRLRQTVFDSLLWRYGSEVGTLLEGIAFNPNVEPSEFTQDRGNRLLEGKNRTQCITGPRRKQQ